jgi:inhibitor of KinA sporulation pathway (predicted exonuclease)
MIKAMIENFMALDLEMNQPSGTIINIGAVIGNIYTGEILDTFNVIIHTSEEIDPFITNLTGIDQEMVYTSNISLSTGFDALKDLHKKHNCFTNVITWGGGDSQELRDQLEIPPDVGLEIWPFGRRWIDTKTLYVAHRLANRERPQGGLKTACRRMGVKFDGPAHNAKQDALNTFRIFMALMNKIK